MNKIFHPSHVLTTFACQTSKPSYPCYSSLPTLAPPIHVCSNKAAMGPITVLLVNAVRSKLKPHGWMEKLVKGAFQPNKFVLE